MAWLGQKITFGYIQLQTHHVQMKISYTVTEASRTLLTRKVTDKEFSNLQLWRKQLTPEYREDQFSNILSAAAQGRSGRLRNLVRAFLVNETSYRQNLQNQIDFLDHEIKYYGSIVALILLLSLWLLLTFLQRSIFTPVRRISQIMVDFLNQKYTYRFTVPPDNEIGHLQTSFNAMAQKVLSQMEELKSLDHAKSEFLSIASHELRTPLTSIKGSLSLMNSGVTEELNDVTKNLIQIAETETDRLIRLINDLLDLTKIEARKLPLDKKWVSVQDLFMKTKESLQGLASSADVQLHVEDSNRLLTLADFDRLQQVLVNLVSNAIKYSPKGESVRIESNINMDRELVITVTDKGKGLSPEDQSVIFEKFRQATGPENPLVRGTGLGLTIAKALVAEHGGQVGVKSKPGQGSTFYFTLPDWKLGDSPVEQPDRG